MKGADDGDGTDGEDANGRGGSADDSGPGPDPDPDPGPDPDSGDTDRDTEGRFEFGRDPIEPDDRSQSSDADRGRGSGSNRDSEPVRPDERELSADSDSGSSFGSDSGSDSESDSYSRIKVDLPDSDNDEDAADADDTDTVATGPPERDPSPDPTESGPDPGPNAIRNWTVLLAALAVVSVATAGVIAVGDGGTEPVAGALLVALAFGGFAAAARSVDAAETALEMLAIGWAEHRRYVWFATGLFAFGTAVGVVLLLAGFNLLEIVAELLEEELFPEFETENGEVELTAWLFIENNSTVFLMAIVGALSLGLLTAFVMVFNGVLVGNIAAAAVDLVGVGFIVAALAPHGIFELPALFIAAGVGFRLLHRLGQRIVGSREAFLTRPYVYRTAVLVLFGWLLLVLAAFVEAYVTLEIVDLVVGEPPQGEDPPVP